MGFFFKNKKKNKEEETVTPVVETTPEVPAKEGMILVREGIKLGLPTVSMEEAIVAAGELLRDLGYVDDDYIPAMIRRNEEASVYMGLGLAIPHGTEDAKRDVKRSGIIVMQYPDGVEFNGGTAQLVIGIAGVGDEHLEILGQITEAVTEEEILEELKKTTDVDYILNTFTRNCPNSRTCSRGIILGNARKIRRDVNVGSFAIFSYLLRSSSARCFKESIRALSSSAFSCLASSTFSRITSARAFNRS